jgi:hypothetical protein
MKTKREKQIEALERLHRLLERYTKCECVFSNKYRKKLSSSGIGQDDFMCVFLDHKIRSFDHKIRRVVKEVDILGQKLNR